MAAIARKFQARFVAGFDLEQADRRRRFRPTYSEFEPARPDPLPGLEPRFADVPASPTRDHANEPPARRFASTWIEALIYPAGSHNVRAKSGESCRENRDETRILRPNNGTHGEFPPQKTPCS